MGTFKSLGEAVDARAVQNALGFGRARLNKLVREQRTFGVGAVLPDPAGILCGSYIWRLKDLEAALPAIHRSQAAVSGRAKAERIERPPLDHEALSRPREFKDGIPHVLGWLDTLLIASTFGTATRAPGEWSTRGRLLPAAEGRLGAGRVWSIDTVLEHRPLIEEHLKRTSKAFG